MISALHSSIGVLPSRRGRVVARKKIYYLLLDCSRIFRKFNYEIILDNTVCAHYSLLPLANTLMTCQYKVRTKVGVVMDSTGPKYKILDETLYIVI